MSSLKGDLKEIRKLEETLFLDLFESAKERHRLGRVRPCKQQRSKPDEYMLSLANISLGFANDMITPNEKAGAEKLSNKELAHNAVQAVMGAT